MDINRERQKPPQRWVLPKSHIKKVEGTKDRLNVFYETLGLLGKGDLQETQREPLSSEASVPCSDPSPFGATTWIPEGICLSEHESSVGSSKVLKRTGQFWARQNTTGDQSPAGWSPVHHHSLGFQIIYIQNEPIQMIHI